MTLFDLLIAMTFVASISAAMGYVHAGFWGYTVALFLSPIVGIACRWALWASAKRVHKFVGDNPKTFGKRLCVGLYLCASLLWPFFAGFLGGWATDPGVVIDAGRLVLAGSAALEVDDKDLTQIQSLELPPHRFMPMILRSDQQNAVTVRIDGNNYMYGGTPLAMLKQEEPPQTGAIKRVFAFSDARCERIANRIHSL